MKSFSKIGKSFVCGKKNSFLPFALKYQPTWNKRTIVSLPDVVCNFNDTQKQVRNCFEKDRENNISK